MINPKCLGERPGRHVLEVMDDTERTDVLIRKNRYLLAKAAEVRRMVMAAQESVAETCLAVQRARIERVRRREVRAPGSSRSAHRHPPPTRAVTNSPQTP